MGMEYQIPTCICMGLKRNDVPVHAGQMHHFLCFPFSACVREIDNVVQWRWW